MATVSSLAFAPEPQLAPGSYTRAISAHELLDRLTERQQQVLTYMAAGFLNKQIAWRLSISEKTVKMHRRLLIDALEVRSSAEAITLCAEASFVEAPRVRGGRAAREEQQPQDA